MNGTTNYPDPSRNMEAFRLDMEISLGLLGLLVIYTLVFYLCFRVRFRVQVPQPRSQPLSAAEYGGYSIAIAPGLDEATLGSFPKPLYSQAKAARGDGGGGSAASSSCCSICLSDYKETDVLRVLPDCGHYFHSKCVDRWLRITPSCPNCRTSPVPTPIVKPLAEDPPSAASRR